MTGYSIHMANKKYHLLVLFKIQEQERKCLGQYMNYMLEEKDIGKVEHLYYRSIANLISLNFIYSFDFDSIISDLAKEGMITLKGENKDKYGELINPSVNITAKGLQTLLDLNNQRQI